MNSRTGRIVKGITLLAVGIGLIVALRLVGQPGTPPVLSLGGPTMGTSWSIQVVPSPGPEDAAAIEAAIGAELARINAQMSTWDPTSELSRFNAHGGTDWFPVSPETAAVVQAALAVSATTGGAFDVTVGPLVDLWGFGPEPVVVAPAPEAIAAVRTHVGWQGLAVRDVPPALRKDDPAIRVDLSAIAKGYAVDALADVLATRGIRHYLVEIGGELRGAGRNPAGTPWRVAVERPVPGARAVQRVLPLDGQAIATSGDYRNVVEFDGERYSHAIDPRTGRPVPLGVASVSVLAPTAMAADAWATALMVLGPDDGLALAEAEGLQALFIVHRGDGFEEIATAPLAALLPSTTGP